MEINGHHGQENNPFKATEHFGNVIVMNRFHGDNQYPPIQQVSAYWEALRGGRLMPKRSEIDPRGIENALENTFVLERIAPGMARMRIAGSHLTDLMGMEVRGMPITSFFTPAGRNALNITLEEVFEKPATVDLTLLGEHGVGKPPIEARMLLLPMKSDLGDVSRILGCLVAKGTIGRTPRRFEIVKTDMRTLAPEPDMFETPPIPQPRAPQAIPGFAEPKPEISRAGSSRRAPHLKLIKKED